MSNEIAIDNISIPENDTVAIIIYNKLGKSEISNSVKVTSFSLGPTDPNLPNSNKPNINYAFIGSVVGCGLLLLILILISTVLFVKRYLGWKIFIY